MMEDAAKGFSTSGIFLDLNFFLQLPVSFTQKDNSVYMIHILFCRCAQETKFLCP